MRKPAGCVPSSNRVDSAERRVHHECMKTIEDNPFVFGGVLIAGLIIGAGLMWAVPMPVNAPSDADSAEGGAVAEAAQQELSEPLANGAVRISNQPAGRAVVVSEVTLPSLGWVVVHEVLPDGALGNALGASRREAGSHTNVIVDLLRGTEPSRTYAVVLYEDNGDKAFDLKADSPISGARASFNANTPSGASRD